MANCERDDIETVWIVIFPLVSLLNYQVSSLREKGIKVVVVGSDSSENQSPKLCLEIFGPRFSHIEEQNRSCIH